MQTTYPDRFLCILSFIHLIITKQSLNLIHVPRIVPHAPLLSSSLLVRLISVMHYVSISIFFIVFSFFLSFAFPLIIFLMVVRYRIHVLYYPSHLHHRNLHHHFLLLFLCYGWLMLIIGFCFPALLISYAWKKNTVIKNHLTVGI